MRKPLLKAIVLAALGCGTLVYAAVPQTEPATATRAEGDEPETPAIAANIPGQSIGTVNVQPYSESGLDLDYFYNCYVAQTGPETYLGFDLVVETSIDATTLEETYYTKARVRYLYSNDTDVVVPDAIRLDDKDIPVTTVYSDYYFYQGVSRSTEGNLKTITFPESITYYYNNYEMPNLTAMYLLGQKPSLYSTFYLYIPMYIASESAFVAIEDDNNWRCSTLIPYGWDFEEITVDVPKPGEFADTYLTNFGNSWAAYRNIKVTGPVNKIDLDAMKNLSKLRSLDLSETEVTEIPENFMTSKYTLASVKLPSTLKNIQLAAFADCRNLETVTIGETEGLTIQDNAFMECVTLKTVDVKGVTSIGRYAFGACLELTGFDFEAVTELEYASFTQCNKLTNVSLPLVEIIPNYCFQNCTSLTSLAIPAATEIGNNAFYYCNLLSEVKLGENLTTISSYAFYNTAIPQITLPASVRTIDSYAFANNETLSKVELNEGLNIINSRAFENCSALTEVTLPSTLQSIGAYAFRNTSIKAFTCKATVPPVANSSFVSDGMNMEEAVLYVPPFSKDVYRNTENWADFFIMRSITEPIDYLSISRPIEITLDEESNAVLANNPTIDLWWDNLAAPGQLTAIGDGTLSAGQFNVKMQKAGRYANYRYGYANCIPTLINEAEAMRADNINLELTLYPYYSNEWHFISFPFDVKVSDIIPDETTYWVIRRYDSVARAAGDTESTWVNLTADDTLEAGKGYILCTYSTGDWAKLTVNSGNSLTKNNFFRSGDYTVDLADYESEFAHNRSWNLVGNPYPAYFDISCLKEDFTAPVTVWNGSNYVAYSPVDDQLTLAPYESFFVQKPVDGSELTFLAEGRRHHSEAREAYHAPARNNVPSISERNVFNFNLTTGGNEDRARIVINPDAEMAYEIGRDAGKFFARENDFANIFVTNGNQFSIDERPLADGSATLGVRATEGTACKVSLDGRFAAEWSVTLTDNVTGKTVDLTQDDYEFIAMGGDESNRLSLVFSTGGGEGTSAVDAVNAFDADAFVTVTTLDGKVVFEGRAADINLPAAVYVISDGKETRKAIVK